MTDGMLPDVADESRRSFMKKGALATGGLALGVGGTGTAMAQDGIGEGGKGVIFTNAFHPAARFTFTSGVVDWNPNVPEVSDNFWTNYQTRMIRWLNTNEHVPFFVAQDANIGEFDEDLGFVVDYDDDQNQPQLFEMNREYTVFGDSPALLTVNFSPVDEEEEDAILENDDWWQDESQNGDEQTPTPDDGGQTPTPDDGGQSPTPNGG